MSGALAARARMINRSVEHSDGVSWRTDDVSAERYVRRGQNAARFDADGAFHALVVAEVLKVNPALDGPKARARANLIVGGIERLIAEMEATSWD